MKALTTTRCIFLLVLFAVLTPAILAGVPAHPVPMITFLSPVSVHPGGPDFTLTVYGANFVSGFSVVNWTGTPLVTTFVSSSQLTATVPAALTAAGGTGWITVSTGVCGLGGCIANPTKTSNVLYLPVANAVSTYVASAIPTTVGNSPYGFSEGDFNNDGKLDLAVANFGDATASILLGNGDGTFLTQQTLTTLPSPFGITMGDLNGDGVPDMVIGNDSTGLDIFLGDVNGDGGFTPGTSLVGGSCPLVPVLADLNQDGNLDIVVGNECQAGVSIYLGNGDGTFGAATSLPGPGALFDGIVADFNGDGILDIAAADYYNSSIDIYLGVGDGTFGAPAILAAASSGIALVAGDFNGDGKVDLALGSQSLGISIFYGNGDGTFQSPTSIGQPQNGYLALALGDMNGDGLLDIVGTTNAGTAEIWLAVGDGTFQSPLTVGSTGTGFALALGNFTVSGGLDIASGSPHGSEINIFLPTVDISPSSRDFGAVSVGTSVQQVFTITNDTSSTVTISSISITGANQLDFTQTNTCSSPLASGGTCTATVTFAPTATGIRSAVLTLVDDAPASPHTAALVGSGVAAPVVVLSPTTLSFGNQNIGAPPTSLPVTLSNTGNAALNIASISITGTNSGDFAQTNNCGATLAPSTQCTVNVTFAPSVAGAETASLQFTDDAGGSPQQVPMSGTGVSAPPSYSITANPTSLSIAQGHSGSTVLTITPIGGMTGTMTFACTGLPAKSNCSFSPSQVVMVGDNQPATVTLTVHTTGPNGVLSELRSLPLRWISPNSQALFIFPAGLMIFLIPAWMTTPKKRRRYFYLPILLLLGALTVIGMTSCGSDSSKATPTGQYSVNAVATVGGANSQSAVVTITITR